MDWNWILSLEDHIAYYSGHAKQRRDGIAFIMRKDIAKTAFERNAVND